MVDGERLRDVGSIVWDVVFVDDSGTNLLLVLEQLEVQLGHVRKVPRWRYFFGLTRFFDNLNALLHCLDVFPNIDYSYRPFTTTLNTFKVQ